MRKNGIFSFMTVSAVAILGLTACKKETFNKPGQTASSSEETTETPGHLKNQVYDAGIRSNDGYPAYNETNRQYYRFYYNSALGQQPVYTHLFGGMASSGDPNGIKGYGATVNSLSQGQKDIEVFAYKRDGVIYVNNNGGEMPVFNAAGTALFTLPIEEIEIHPKSFEVYALVRNGNIMQIYRLESDGSSLYAKPMKFNGTTSTVAFGNVMVNGYKSGSICFIPDPTNSRNTCLVFTHESSVYSSSGIISWFYDIDASIDNLTSRTDLHKNFYTGIPAPQAGKINTTYGDGKFYLAKDGGTSDDGKLYELQYQVTGATGTVIPTTIVVTNKNDFGYWRNF